MYTVLRRTLSEAVLEWGMNRRLGNTFIIKDKQ